MSVHTPTRFVLAPDSFKGTLSSERVAEIISDELLLAWPHAECRCVPVGDGGEGTLEALVATGTGRYEEVDVTGPLGEPMHARFALLSSAEGELHAFIEAAQANGLTKVPPEKRDPRATTSYGVGELIARALEHGANAITLAIGGSATNDGGMGMMQALGVVFYDEDGHELEGYGCNLSRVASMNATDLDARLRDVHVWVMCDVDTPLLGPHGATYTFALQKGAAPEDLAGLEQDMAHYAHVVEATCGTSYAATPGAGAAGGIGFAARTFLDAELVSGIDAVLDLVGFDEVLSGADLCITGEGCFDAQTSHGKVIQGVAECCARANVRCIAICGIAEPKAQERGLPGLAALFPTLAYERRKSHILPDEAENNLRATVQRVIASISSGEL